MKKLLLLLAFLLISASAFAQNTPPNWNGTVSTLNNYWSPQIVNCTVTMSTKTTTEMAGCSAANVTTGRRYYVTDIHMATTTAGTTTTLQLVSGTGTNCGTNQTAESVQFPNVAITTIYVPLTTPLVAPLGAALCVIQAGTTAGTTNVQVNGVMGP